MEVWHFVGDKLRDGREVPEDGIVLSHEGTVVPCHKGFHGSEKLIDALEWAPGNNICRCILEGDLTPHGNPINKWAGRYRTILWRIDGTNVLRQFAKELALSVIHLWDTPDVVRQYLETGDQSLQDKALALTKAAPRVDSRSESAAHSAVLAATFALSNLANESSIRYTTWVVAVYSTVSIDRDMSDASKGLVWNTVWDRANDLLTEMVMGAHLDAHKGEQ